MAVSGFDSPSGFLRCGAVRTTTEQPIMSTTHDADDGRTDDERREHPVDGRRTEYPPWHADVSKGDKLRLTYDRRGEIPAHWDRVKTHTVVVTGSPVTGAGMPCLRVEGPYAMHTDGEVSIHADGGVYHTSREEGVWSVQMGRHATIETVDDDDDDER